MATKLDCVDLALNILNDRCWFIAIFPICINNFLYPPLYQQISSTKTAQQRISQKKLLYLLNCFFNQAAIAAKKQVIS